MNDKEYLLARKEELKQSLADIEILLNLIDNLEKPYVANVSAYSGHYSTQFKTEEQAKKKLEEYASKRYFRNGLNYGVYLYKWNEDGTKTLIESRAVGRKTFQPNLN